MGITQWVLQDAQAGENPAQDVPLSQAQPVLDKASVNEPPAKAGGDVKAIAQPAPGVTPVAPSQTAEPKLLSLESLRAEVAECVACALAKARTQTVFGEGPDQADWLFVGEAPGQQEDRQGQPFVGRAGGLFTQMIKALDKSREQVYIANTLKCRPPGNRDPLPDELQACEPFLLKQIQLLQPKVIVALGRISAQALLRSDQPLGRLRGQVYQYGPNQIPLIVTYHPAYLLRQPADKAKVWADLLLAHRQIPL
ncbi:MAG: uracil-DNA glycosylase [Proteobacteria bacterium]|nr:uracil-DNA glycosylase [Pseudomonadota bacterium]